MMNHLLNALTRPPAGRTVSVSGENVYGKPGCGGMADPTPGAPYQEDVEAIGWEDYLARGAIFAIEWPERAGSLIPQAARHVGFHHMGEERRRISIDTEGKFAV